MKEVVMMYNREIANEKAEKLEEEIRKHRLTDDELAAYHDNAVDEVDRARIEGQLARDPIARRRYEMMEDVQATYTETPPTQTNVRWLQQQLAQMEEDDSPETVEEPPKPPPISTVLNRLNGLLGELAEFLVQTPDGLPSGAHGAGYTPKKRYSKKGNSPDGSLSWTVWERTPGGRTVSISTPNTECEGYRIVVEVGNLRKEPTLKWERNRMRASVEFTREEIRSLPPRARESVKVYSAEPASINDPS
jgi:hypothetical protein